MPTWAFLVPEAGFSARPRCLKDEPEVPQFANPLCLLTASSNVSGSIQRSWGQSRLADPNTDARSKKTRSILNLTPLLCEPRLNDHHRTSRGGNVDSHAACRECPEAADGRRIRAGPCRLSPVDSLRLEWEQPVASRWDRPAAHLVRRLRRRHRGRLRRWRHPLRLAGRSRTRG